ncbi:hypothetical protein DPMN_068896 [Dreissena polymorpha]|uniref:Uncharacterized protein n=1 Tax=Dreissena polymorpha TaxID=45954 RepID=A0A9D3YY13_DREPO|nr:hypothetical protein DPMN_068896 [Dreissena polymorpha]
MPYRLVFYFKFIEVPAVEIVPEQNGELGFRRFLSILTVEDNKHLGICSGPGMIPGLHEDGVVVKAGKQ